MLSARPARVPAVVIVVAVLAMLLVSGCTANAEPSPQTSACSYDTTFEGVHVSGTGGQQPTVEITDTTPATQLGVQDLCLGVGAAASASSTVTVNYVGVGLSSGQTFDSSYGGSPVTFPLNQVIPGWQQGLQGMKAGGTRLLVIPAELAYGATPPGPGIQPNETLVFVVDLISVA
jgi:peptidylprolyl isomerase